MCGQHAVDEAAAVAAVFRISTRRMMNVPLRSAATTHRAFPVAQTGIVVGLTLALIHLVTIPVDNTSVNPARSIATALFAGTDALKQLWAFVVFPIVGAFVGVLAWVAVDDAKLEDTMLGEIVDELT